MRNINFDTKPHQRATLLMIFVKLLGAALIILSAYARIMLVFCDMRGQWALNVVDGCSIYARYLFPWIFGLDLFCAVLLSITKSFRTSLALITFPVLLTVILYCLVMFWTDGPPL